MCSESSRQIDLIKKKHQTVLTIVTITAFLHLYMHFSNYFSGPPQLQTCSTAYVHNVICVRLLSTVSLVNLVIGLWDVGTLVKIIETNEKLRLGLWIYWISKYYELLDTVFMLLRHRLRQMSFLHVFHHASMAFLSDYSSV